MAAQSQTHSASSSDGDGGGGSGADDELLLAALLDGMDAALCAFDAEGVVTHWNREAERILGWTQQEAVGRQGLGGWAVRTADAEETEGRLLGTMKAPGRQVHEFAMVTKEGGRVLVRTQSSGVVDGHGRPMGVYCAFSEVHAQIDLERSIALSEALFEDASWGVVLVDADLRPAVVNVHAAHAFRVSRTALLGRPLGEFVEQGLEELEGAFQHVLAEGTPPSPTEIWVTLRQERASRGTRQESGSGPGTGGAGSRGVAGAFGGGDPGHREEQAREAKDAKDAAQRRCWRSGFVRLASPLAEEPVPLGVAWLFHDVTDTKRIEQDAARLRFRDNQLHRAARAAAECEDPMEAATVHLDFALAGFADHALLDLTPAADAADGGRAARAGATGRTRGAGNGPRAGRAGTSELKDDDAERTPCLVRAAATPVSAPGPVPPIEPDPVGGIPIGYGEAHPALQAYERCGSVRASVGGAAVPGWAAARKWPEGTVHALCTVLRSRGRSLGVVTFLRGSSRRSFDRTDAVYAEDIAVRIAAAIDLADATR